MSSRGWDRDLEAIRARKEREHDEFVGSFATLERMKFHPRLDYGRKRGVVEEINRTVQSVEDNLATRNAFVTPAPMRQGAVDHAVSPASAAR